MKTLIEKKKTVKDKKVTQKAILKFNLCEHHKVGYKELEKLCDYQIKQIKKRDKVIERLSIDVERKGLQAVKLEESKKLWILHVNEQLLKRVENSNKELREQKDYYDKEIKFLEEQYDKAIEHNREMIKVNDQNLQTNKDILKSHNEITRAYNGLAEMGKFVGQEVIDKHNKMLPENSPDDFTDFKSKHTLLENGKVLHQWTMKKKKKEIKND